MEMPVFLKQTHKTIHIYGEPLWLSGKVVKNENINEIKRTRVRSLPPRATSFKKKSYYQH
jgi:hypothetical protein